MEFTNANTKIEKFVRRLDSIIFKEFKVCYITMILNFCLRHGLKFINTFVFQKITKYLILEALDVYEQHASILSKTIQQPNPYYAHAIVVAFQAILARAIVTHVIIAIIGRAPMSITLTPIELATITTDITPTIDTHMEFDLVITFYDFLAKEFI